MPDKYGRPTFTDWVGIAGQLSNMRANEEDIKMAQMQQKAKSMEISYKETITQIGNAEGTIAAGDEKSGMKQYLKVYDLINDGIEIQEVIFQDEDEMGNGTLLRVIDLDGNEKTVPAPSLDKLRQAAQQVIRKEDFGNMFIQNSRTLTEKNNALVDEALKNPLTNDKGETAIKVRQYDPLTGVSEIVNVAGDGTILTDKQAKGYSSKAHQVADAQIGASKSTTAFNNKRTAGIGKMTKAEAYKQAIAMSAKDSLSEPASESDIRKLADSIYKYANGGDKSSAPDEDILGGAIAKVKPEGTNTVLKQSPKSSFDQPPKYTEQMFSQVLSGDRGVPTPLPNPDKATGPGIGQQSTSPINQRANQNPVQEIGKRGLLTVGQDNAGELFVKGGADREWRAPKPFEQFTLRGFNNKGQ